MDGVAVFEAVILYFIIFLFLYANYFYMQIIFICQLFHINDVNQCYENIRVLNLINQKIISEYQKIIMNFYQYYF